MALAGAEILLYPTAIGWDPDDDQAEKDRQRDAWILSHRGHAVANGLPVLSCNRVGHEPSPLGASGIDFWGNSHVLGPQGEFVAEAGATRRCWCATSTWAAANTCAGSGRSCATPASTPTAPCSGAIAPSARRS